jgi:hypothetical protein
MVTKIDLHIDPNILSDEEAYRRMMVFLHGDEAEAVVSRAREAAKNGTLTPEIEERFLRFMESVPEEEPETEETVVRPELRVIEGGASRASVSVSVALNKDAANKPAVRVSKIRRELGSFARAGSKTVAGLVAAAIVMVFVGRLLTDQRSFDTFRNSIHVLITDFTASRHQSQIPGAVVTAHLATNSTDPQANGSEAVFFVTPDVETATRPFIQQGTGEWPEGKKLQTIVISPSTRPDVQMFLSSAVASYTEFRQYLRLSGAFGPRESSSATTALAMYSHKQAPLRQNARKIVFSRCGTCNFVFGKTPVTEARFDAEANDFAWASSKVPHTDSR